MRKVLATVALASLLAGACSSPPSKPAVVDSSILKSAAERARAAGTAKLALTVRMVLPQSKEPLVIAGSGAIDFRRALSSFDIDYTELFRQFRAPKGTSARFTFVYTTSALFLRLPPGAEDAGRGKLWVSIALKILTGPAGGNPFAALGSSDPGSNFDALNGVIDVARAGEATIRGVRTTEYRGRLDVARALRSVPAARRAAFQDAFRSGGDKGVPIRVWLDGGGLPRRMRIDTGVSASFRNTITIDWFDYGKPSSIVLPRASETLRLTKSADFAQVFARLLTPAKT